METLQLIMAYSENDGVLLVSWSVEHNREPVHFHNDLNNSDRKNNSKNEWDSYE